MINPEPTRAVVLLSGGQDSTTCAYWAASRWDELHAVTLDYGQAHATELAAAAEVAALVGVTTHVVLSVAAFAQLRDSALVASPHDVAGLRRRVQVHPHGMDAVLDGYLVAKRTGDESPDQMLDRAASDLAALGGREDMTTEELVALVRANSDRIEKGRYVDSGKRLPSTYVPGRNLLMLTLAAARAAQVGAHDVVVGVCQTDYSGYPDCRGPFVEAAAYAAELALPSSCRPLRVHAPLLDLTKAETVELAASIPGCVPALAVTVTCYRGLRPGCGECPSCVLRERGFREAGIPDPSCQ